MLIHYYDLTAGVKKGASRLPQRDEGRGAAAAEASWSGLCLGKDEDSCTRDVAECAREKKKKKKGCGTDPCCLCPPALMM